jgi:hypothetical protein
LQPHAEAARDPIQVVDKSALNSQLSQSCVTELMDRARIGWLGRWPGRSFPGCRALTIIANPASLVALP